MIKTFNHIHLTDASLVASLDLWLRLEAGLNGDANPVDKVNGAIIPSVVPIVENSDHTYDIQCIDGIAEMHISNWSCPDYTGKDWCLWAVVNGDAGAAFSIIEMAKAVPHPNSPLVQISESSSSVNYLDGIGEEATISVGGITYAAGDTLTKIVLTYYASGNATLYYGDVRSTLTSNTPASTAPASGMTLNFGGAEGTDLTLTRDLINDGALPVATLGMASFSDGNMPVNMKNICDWMCERAASGHKELYPGLDWR